MLEIRPHQRLLKRLLDEPDLAQRVQRMPPEALTKIIDDVGLEDAGEIVALATAEQLLGLFDEDLWSSGRPGVDEVFDARRFVLWLEVMGEAGPAFVARAVSALPEAMLQMALSELLFVIDVDSLALEMEGGGADADRIEKALEGSPRLDLDEYLIVWRDGPGWDAVAGLLAELHADYYDLFQRVLASCCEASTQRILGDGGLQSALTQAEVLTNDAAAERADRRAERGYVAPSDATAFLRLARSSPLEGIVKSGRDPVVRAYFRELERDVLLASPPSADDGPGLAATGKSSSNASHPMRDALAALRHADVAAFAERVEEMAFLVNVVIAGCSLDERRVRSAEAAEIVLALCEVGLQHLAGVDAEAVRQAVAEHGADKLFRIGWHMLATWSPDVEPWVSLAPSTRRLLRALRFAASH